MKAGVARVDVGFPNSRETTGLAWVANSTIDTDPAGSSWPKRSHSLPRNVRISIVALDAAIVPKHNYDTTRGCERVFYGGANTLHDRKALRPLGTVLRRADYSGEFPRAQVVRRR
jgi:hypothetical protein